MLLHYLVIKQMKASIKSLTRGLPGYRRTVYWSNCKLKPGINFASDSRSLLSDFGIAVESYGDKKRKKNNKRYNFPVIILELF